MRTRTKVAIVVSLIASFFIGIVFADPSKINQFTDQITDASNKIPLAKDSKRTPIEVYDYCKSFIRIDLKYIETSCFKTKPSWGDTAFNGDIKFKFKLPTELEQGFPNTRALFNQDSKVYQYDKNDFEIGLFDEIGEKVYQIHLWELP